MKVDLILPIAKLHGKLNSKAPYYFKTMNGKTFAADVTRDTFRLWLHSDAEYLRSQGISPKAKLLPPQVVRYLIEKYDIEV